MPREISLWDETVSQKMAFDPVALGAVHWQRGDVAQTDSAGRVSSWLDLSGRNNHAAQATAASRPLLTRVRGIPTVEFVSSAAAQRWLELPNCFAGATAGFFIGVLKLNVLSTAGPYDQGLPYAHQFGGNPRIGSSSNVVEQAFSTVASAFGTMPGRGFNQLNFFLYSIENRSSPNAHIMHINGAQHGSTFASAFGVGPIPRLGRSSTSAYFNGHIAEAIGFARTILRAERQMLEGYLAWRYGLESILPVTHPYRVVPPMSAM